VAQAQCVQVGSNRLNGLGRLGELCLRCFVSPEPCQDRAKGRLPQPHLAGRLDILGHLDGRCQRLRRVLESLACRQYFSLQPLGAYYVLARVGLRGQF